MNYSYQNQSKTDPKLFKNLLENRNEMGLYNILLRISIQK